MARVLFDSVWKRYDRRYGSNRFRRLLFALFRRDPGQGEFWALKDVSFGLERGESLGIVGPNGAGKTTILRVLSGVSEIDRGHVLVEGRVSAMIALGAGFHPELTGRENIFLNGSILGLERSEIRRYFDAILEFADIGEYIDAPVKRYSSGMFARLGFAVAAQVQPDLLLVDEVLAVGDGPFQARCHERLRELRKQGTCVVLVSHDMWAIRRSCTRGIYLSRGEIVAKGSVGEVVDRYAADTERAALGEMAHRRGGAADLSGTNGVWCDLEVRARGAATSTACWGEPLTFRLKYHCPEPIESPVLVVGIYAHDGTTAATLRSRKAGWLVQRLEGDGYVDVALERLEMNPGHYMCQLNLKDGCDLGVLGRSRMAELIVSAPDAAWGQDHGAYTPDARWGSPQSVDSRGDDAGHTDTSHTQGSRVW